MLSLCLQLLSVTWARTFGVLIATALWMTSRSAAWCRVPVLLIVYSSPLRASYGAGVSWWLPLSYNLIWSDWVSTRGGSHPFFLICFPGRNDKGQLGHGDTKRLEAPKLIEGLADHLVVAAACGRNHTLALTGRLSNLFSLTRETVIGVCSSSLSLSHTCSDIYTCLTSDYIFFRL